ncbi:MULTISPECIES: oligosaccharide flippase family protein [Methylobacterium]|uniref:oligosaccharide flippase family protein n=1 Tax=Methylobacterium TaxID=407 RepID=UPI0013E9DE50|nr:oligosaccharide flippase family protein [Methylobacterium sp. DB0501]NGM33669.1 oligosaccharide flippase family protein [Methylobacterium sp. DB0501]
MNLVKRAVLLVSGERYLVLSITLVQTALVSRLLTPEQVGLSMLGVALVQVVDGLRDFGTTNYIIHEPTTSQQSARTAFTVLLALSLVFAAGLFASADLWAGMYGQPVLAPYLRVLSLSFLLVPFSGPLMAMMRRDFQFASLMWVNVGIGLTYAVVLVGLAYLGFGALSFAWAMVGSAAAAVALSLAVRPEPGVYRPSLQGWRTALAIGGFSSVNTLLTRAYDLLPIFLLGRFGGPDLVGLYGRAQVLSQLPDKMILGSLSTVILPMFAADRRDGRPLAPTYLASIGNITAVLWPISVLLALIAHPVVMVLLGSQWLASVPIFQVLALASMLTFPAMLTYPVLLASEGLRDTLTASLIGLPPSAVILFAAASGGPLAVAASQFLTVPLQAGIALWFIRRRVPFGLADFVGALRISALVALATALPPIAVIALTGRGFALTIPEGVLAGFGGAAAWLVAMLVLDHPIAGHIRETIRPVMIGLRARTRAVWAGR